MRTLERPTTKMNPYFKSLWVQALRSQMFKQATDALRCDSGYCCLGVIATVLQPLGWEERISNVGDPIWVHPLGDSEEELLSRETCEQLGLSEEWMNYLAQMNDGGASFEDIANEIEEYL